MCFFQELKMPIRNAYYAFVMQGFCNWKLATTSFWQHEASACHKEAVERVLTLPVTTKDSGEALSSAHAQEKLENCRWSLKII